MANTRSGFVEGATVFVRAKVGGGVVLLPATITQVEAGAEGSKQRTLYHLAMEGGNGTGYANEASLIPR